MRLTFATGNKGKFAEARAVLGPAGIELDQWPHGYPEVQADTLDEVARFGAEALAERLEPPFFLEDAGLFVDRLDGFPGVYSAYAFQTLGYEGILKLLAGSEGATERSARFEAVVAYHDGDDVRLIKGVAPGRIARQARGDQGFGFDPIFVPEGHERRTYAEMDEGEKAPISHRGRALNAFAALLKERAH